MAGLCGRGAERSNFVPGGGPNVDDEPGMERPLWARKIWLASDQFGPGEWRGSSFAFHPGGASPVVGEYRLLSLEENPGPLLHCHRAVPI